MTNKIALTRDEDGWFLSSFTNGSAACVQVKFTEQSIILVRDSKDRKSTSPIISMPSNGWVSLLKNISNPT